MTTTAPTARNRILVVDDDRLILATLSKGLQQAGYDVVQAANGEEALRVVQTTTLDLALLDVRMPSMSGIEVALQLRRHGDVPFMFLSAYGDVELARQVADYGAVGYLVKPIDTPQIVPAIEAGLARAAEIRQLRRTEADLTVALSASRDTAIATGVVMERFKLGRDQAFAMLRDHARSQRRKLSEVAADLIRAQELLNLPDARETKDGS